MSDDRDLLIIVKAANPSASACPSCVRQNRILSVFCPLNDEQQWIVAPNDEQSNRPYLLG
jgi:hypothetical protein